MGNCFSVKGDTIVVTNTIQIEIDKWNERREEVIKFLDPLTELYIKMDTRKERLKLIEENIEVFKEFFNLPPIENGIYEQIEYMFRVGLHRYMKPPK
jgi:hypothetical protein